MLSDTIHEKQKKLNDLLTNLTDKLLASEADERSYLLSLIDIYKGDEFRHEYSSFFPIVKEAYDNDKIDTLIGNLTSLLNLFEDYHIKKEQCFDDYKILKQIRKLCDHINLEAVRLNYVGQYGDTFKQLAYQSNEIQKSQQIIEQKLREASKMADEAEGKSKEAKEEADSAKKELKNSHSHTVAILSIFAAIVIAFSGSLTIFGNVLSSVSEAPILSLMLAILACGIILLNTIAVLMLLVGKITGRDFFSKCVEEHCHDCKNAKGKTKCYLLKRAEKRMPFLFWMNVVLIVAILAVSVLLILQYFGVIF